MKAGKKEAIEKFLINARIIDLKIKKQKISDKLQYTPHIDKYLPIKFKVCI